MKLQFYCAAKKRNSRARFLKLHAALLLCAATAASQSTTVNVQVSNQINPSVGVNGRLQVAMSTSFQLASWSYQFFTQTPQALAPGPAVPVQVSIGSASSPLTVTVAVQ
jgi:hypothetical protein